MSPRKASGAPITDVTAVSAFAAEGSPYSFAGEFKVAPPNEKEAFTPGKKYCYRCRSP